MKFKFDFFTGRKIFPLFIMCFLIPILNSCQKNEAENGFNSVKIGFIYNNTVSKDGYCMAHEEGRKALEKEDFRTMYAENVPENELCLEVIDALISLGCNLIYSTSFGYAPYILQAAEKYPEVKFCQCGTDIRSSNVSNYFGKVYEARFLSGIAAGKKTVSSKIGYVAAFPTPEVIRGLNAFALGVQYANPSATVEVLWTEDWNNPVKESDYAEFLCVIENCDVLAHHVNSDAVQQEAQRNGKFCIGYNYNGFKTAPKAYLTAPFINWKSFYLDDALAARNGTWESRSYWEGLESEMVGLDQITKNCVKETKNAVYLTKLKIINKSLRIFQGPLYNTEDELMVEKGSYLEDSEIASMTWFVKGIEFPEYEPVEKD